jgi:hypothetical protein
VPVVVGGYNSDVLGLFEQPDQKAVSFVGARSWVCDDGASSLVNACSMIVLPFAQQDIKVLSGTASLTNRGTDLIREALKERKPGRTVFGNPSTDKYHQLAGLLGGDDVIGDI